ncbi:SDR family NAD(P)-dependent oxidoreductase [Bacillus sp. 165]|uniref:SDR family NAD(P)-dependent oxidoreductase n=1 Tax=Bacillus sp. 165 TaxID=1529117 RepID=UPI001AD9CD75|nr:SDR family NAD(P)-dependent oxidoreductase [Bacillus sp. 165]MBO9130570.1 SDR family NAD(P)-dependent oxidoreductase [Bacillus sp. 165]
MKIMITGGAGFIGSHLAIRLLKDGHQVTLLDNFHDYYLKSRKLYHLQQIEQAGFASFYECDILQKLDVKKVIEKEKPDAIVHLAAVAGVRTSLQKPELYIDVNMKGLSNVLACAGEEQVAHVLFSSSSSVYGERQNQPLAEHMADGKVLSPYAASKFGAEALVHAYEHMYGFQTTILRFFTVYGTWGRPDMAMASFIRKLLNKDSITVYGKGTGRDYTYVDDIVQGIVLALYAKDSDVYNIGSNSPILMTDVLGELVRHFPSMQVNWGGSQKGDATSTWADITKAKTKLGFKPNIAFEEGLERTVAWAKKHPQLI